MSDDPRLVKAIDVHGPVPFGGPGSCRGRCISSMDCVRAGGCCFPPLVLIDSKLKEDEVAE